VPTFNSLISRDASDDPLVPTPVSSQIIQEMPTQSAILQRARRVQLASNTQRQPVLDVLPTAYFVGTGNDTGLKQTTSQDWKNVNLVVEEIACIVPIPEAYLDDAQVPIWDEVRPRMTEALGRLVDAACLFGANRPTTWGTDIYTGAIAAGNSVAADDGDTAHDFGNAVSAAGELLAADGYAVDGFASRPGLRWKLIGIRTSQGVPVYEPDMQNGTGGNLYGYPLSEVNNGGWDTTKAELIAGDWSKAIVGMRQDITFKMFTEGVISDDDGKVILNLMQQDSVAMRMVMRMAFATANPVTPLNTNSATRYPFAVIHPGTTVS
jgi:HK97 family phage major capsid protein